MRKFIYSLFAVLALSCTFVSCSDDDDDAAAPAGDPAQAAAATYTGTWTQVLQGDSVEYSAPGTITITPGDTAFVANVAVASDQIDYVVNGSSAHTSLNASEVANIAFAGADGNSFVFTNSAGATLGNFYGRIDEGTITMRFSQSQRVRRKNYTFVYTFVGTRQ